MGYEISAVDWFKYYSTVRNERDERVTRAGEQEIERSREEIIAGSGGGAAPMTLNSSGTRWMKTDICKRGNYFFVTF